VKRCLAERLTRSGIGLIGQMRLETDSLLRPVGSEVFEPRMFLKASESGRHTIDSCIIATFGLLQKLEVPVLQAFILRVIL
jgi:hypothetical protein